MNRDNMLKLTIKLFETGNIRDDLILDESFLKHENQYQTRNNMKIPVNMRMKIVELDNKFYYMYENKCFGYDFIFKITKDAISERLVTKLSSYYNDSISNFVDNEHIINAYEFTKDDDALFDNEQFYIVKSSDIACLASVKFNSLETFDWSCMYDCIAEAEKELVI